MPPTPPTPPPAATTLLYAPPSRSSLRPAGCRNVAAPCSPFVASARRLPGPLRLPSAADTAAAAQRAREEEARVAAAAAPAG